MTEFEKLQAIIADVLRSLWELKKILTSRSITKRQRRSQQCRMLLIRSRKRRLMNNQIVR